MNNSRNSIGKSFLQPTYSPRWRFNYCIHSSGHLATVSAIALIISGSVDKCFSHHCIMGMSLHSVLVCFHMSVCLVLHPSGCASVDPSLLSGCSVCVWETLGSRHFCRLSVYLCATVCVRICVFMCVSVRVCVSVCFPWSVEVHRMDNSIALKCVSNFI